MSLVWKNGKTHLVTDSTKKDHTTEMTAYARRRATALSRERLSGFILKSRSPSCGLENVPIRNVRGKSVRRGRGLFAEALVDRFPVLPIEEEGSVSDLQALEAWLERVRAYRRRRLAYLEGLLHGALGGPTQTNEERSKPQRGSITKGQRRIRS